MVIGIQKYINVYREKKTSNQIRRIVIHRYNLSMKVYLQRSSEGYVQITLLSFFLPCYVVNLMYHCVIL